MEVTTLLRMVFVAAIIHCSTSKPDEYPKATGVLTFNDAPVPRTCCPDSFTRIGDKCFHVGLSITNWFGALKACRKLGARLAVVENDAEKYALVALLKLSKGVEHYWLGGQSIYSHHSIWTSYVTGERLPYLSWCRKQPNKPYSEHCLLGSAPEHGCFHDHLCEQKSFNYVCQTSPTN